MDIIYNKIGTGEKSLHPLGLAGSFAVYIPAGILMYGMTKFLIPYLSETTGQETIFYWFVVGGLGIFTPLTLAGLAVLKREGYSMTKTMIKDRLRFKRLTKSDILWSLGGLTAAGILSGIVMFGLESALGAFDHSPAFMAFEPLSKGRYWLLLVWLPYWLLNILGEEFLWRGVMLPRQEIAFGNHAWFIHGIGWLLFHIAFGWQLLLTLLPLMFILPWVVQKTKNSWVGVIMHAGLNGPSFIAISFGLI